MAALKFTLADTSGGGVAFPTTHWSVVLRAGAQQTPECGAALETLCRGYWYPLYAYLRRRGHDAHDAQDLTQEFFSRVLEDNSLRTVHPGKGRFRSFLIASLDHLLANEWHRSQRQKRGGGQAHFSLDEETAEDRYQHDPPDHSTPETIYKQRWAETLLQRVLDRLRDEWEYKGTPCHFADLKVFLVERKGTAPFGDVATRLGTSESALKYTVHKLRRRYRELFRDEIAHTVSSLDEIDDEIRHLFSVLAG